MTNKTRSGTRIRQTYAYSNHVRPNFSMCKKEDTTGYMRVRNLAVAAAILSLVACSAAGNQPITPSYATTAQQQFETANKPAASFANLYVANADSITVYAPGASIAKRTITKVNPLSLGFDQTGNLYAVNSPPNGSAGSVIVYGAGTSKVIRTITQGLSGPHDLVLDSKGTLYVANSYIGVVEYAPGKTTMERKIANFFPISLAIDKSNNLYVGRVPGPYGGKGASVRVFSAKNAGVLRTITSGIGDPTGLAFSPSGNLYVANQSNAAVTVYAPGSTSVMKSITKGTKEPFAVAFDGTGNLYVADTANSVVTVYAPGSTSLLRTIHTGISHPVALAFDSSNNLYVANSASVSVYAPGASVPKRTITKGVSGPAALVFGP